MSQLRVCIGSNDGITIATSHMGDTESFYIYDIFENGPAKFLEKRINTARELDHAQVNKMQAIIKLLQDAEIFVAEQKSPNFVKIAAKTKHQPVVVKAKNIAEVLQLLQDSFGQIFELVEKRKQQGGLEVIPELP